MIRDLIPNGAILIWSIVLSCCRFENARWIAARQSGYRGSGAAVGPIVDGGGIFGLVAVLAIAALSLFDFGWRKTLGLWLLAMSAGFVWAAVGAFAHRAAGKLTLWAVGTVMLYVSAIVLFFQFTWFGAFR